MSTPEQGQITRSGEKGKPPKGRPLSEGPSLGRRRISGGLSQLLVKRYHW